MELKENQISIKLSNFTVETKSGTLKSFDLRTRWLLSEKNPSEFPIGAAVGHAECRGRIACGHAECRGRIACGPLDKAPRNISELEHTYKEALGAIPQQAASIFELLEAKAKAGIL